MNTSAIIAAAVYATLAPPPAFADGRADEAGIKKASNEFYRAIEALDDGKAMAAVWKQAPYVTLTGPLSMNVIHGWDAVSSYWLKSNAMFKLRQADIVEGRIHADGGLAWEVGREVGDIVMADGSKRHIEWAVTNIYEKQTDGAWLMVSHHVEP